MKKCSRCITVSIFDNAQQFRIPMCHSVISRHFYNQPLLWLHIYILRRAGQIKIIPKKYIGNWKSHSPTIIIYVNFWLEDVILWDFIAYSKLLYCFWDGVTALKWGQLFSEVAVHSNFFMPFYSRYFWIVNCRVGW